MSHHNTDNHQSTQSLERFSGRLNDAGERAGNRRGPMFGRLDVGPTSPSMDLFLQEGIGGSLLILG